MEIKPTHRRVCETCKKDFIAPKKISGPEALKRRFCCKRCAAAGRWQDFLKSGLPPRATGIRVETADGVKFVRPNRRVRAIKRYTENPRACRECGGPILLREKELPVEMRYRQFCTPECSDKARNRFWDGKEESDFYDITTLPAKVQVGTLPFRTLGQDNSRRSYTHNHARKVYSSAFPDEYFCQICEKSSPVPVEVCHIRPVASFADSDTLLMINQLDNLVGADHICHKMFDQGQVSMETVYEIVKNRVPAPR